MDAILSAEFFGEVGIMFELNGFRTDKIST